MEQLLIECFYVDNFVTSTPNIQQAKNLFTEINDLFNKVSMELTPQWGSNSPEMRSLYSATQTLKNLIVEVLGILWDQHRYFIP